MNTINDGGPAFPHSSQPLDDQGNPMCGEHSEWGMSLRDWFAGKALAGMLARPLARGDFLEFDDIAKGALNYAEAMIAARNQTA